MQLYSTITVFFTLFALAACGGGGSSPPVNLPPIFSGGSQFTTVEGSVIVGNLFAADPENKAVSYSLVNNQDSEFFSLNSSGQLRFVNPPNYEQPFNNRDDNRYLTRVSASDGVKESFLDVSIVVLDALEGRVVDGPLSGSLVFLDLDGDFTLDNDEPQTTTDSMGYFVLNDSEFPCGAFRQCSDYIVAYGGVDTSTSIELRDFLLVAELQRNKDFIISPLSTLLSGAAVPADIIRGFKLSVSVEELSLLDPWQLAEANDGSLLALNQQIGLIILTLDTLVGATSSVTMSQVVPELISVVSALADAGNNINLDDAFMVADIIDKTLAQLADNSVPDSDTIQLVAAKVAMINRVLGESQNDLTENFSVAVVRAAQTDLQLAISDLNSRQLTVDEFLQTTAVELLFVDVPANDALVNSDGDSLPDLLDDDDDNDSVPDNEDAFPLDATESLDTDGDEIGNNADIDDDNDSVPDREDAFPLVAEEWLDTDGDAIGNNADIDDDNDSVPDSEDAFPLVAEEWLDTDGDAIGNNADIDDDNDSVPDTEDAFPLVAEEWLDTDGDEIGNNADIDDDNDSVPDNEDAFPLDATEWLDSDGDNIGSNADTDDDNDSFVDTNDAFPLDASEWLDTDGDQIGNNADMDDDNDSVPDNEDAFPLDAAESIDTDGDEIGNNADPDDDNDSVPDNDDAFPLDAAESIDTDGDEIGNNADPDDDNDSVPDTEDAFPLDAAEWLDSDGDNIGNNADPDDDNDSVVDNEDAFPLDAAESLDTDGDQIGNNADPDDDNDSVPDTEDAFPLDAAESIDTDGDEIGNNADPDDDNDGVPDTEDAFPLDAAESIDTDGDEIGNNADPDDDNDSVPDTEDAFPLDAAEWLDSDGDNIGNNADPDDDNDSVVDNEDAFPLDAAESLDTDGDQIGNNADPDDDNDSVPDNEDAFPLDAAESLDTDGDQIGNNADPDDDNDSVPDTEDAFPLDAAESIDTDGDEIGNNADPDDDNDSVPDNEDAFPLDAAESLDTDGDQIGNNADPDDDNDSVPDNEDAFPLDAAESLDTDGDQIGNNADPDDDNDSVPDNEDAFPLDPAESIDTDGDEIGNNADPDDDNDGVPDTEDAFPLDAAESLDTDGDQIGNNADPDDDNDSVVDNEDAFPLDAAESIDTDGDEIGNNADPDDDNDSFLDTNDAFPLDAGEWLDTDGDQIGNNADTDDDNDSVVDNEDAFPLDATESLDTDGDQIGNNADLDDDGDGVIDERDDAPLDASITPPTAMFYVDKLQGSAPLIVSFDASDTIAGYGDDTLVSYSWDFNDGSSGSGITVSHSFETAGDFAVALTVLNSDGLTDTFTETVMVSPGSFSVSGVISVADSVRIDSDVNDLAAQTSTNNSFSRAQLLDIPANLIGYANTASYGSSGKSFSSGDPRDYYQFEALGGEIINLIMDSPGSTADGYTDLDMYLYDSNFDLVGYSISSTQYESLMIPLEVGTYYLRVNVWSEGAAKYYLSISADNTSLGSGWSSDSEFAIGDIIVQERVSKSRATASIALNTLRPASVRSMSRAGPKLYRYGATIGRQNTPVLKGARINQLTVPSDAEMRVATLLKAKELSLNPSIDYAEPNFLRRSTQVPIDERYGTQWHYEQIRLPEAWDITTGSAEVKVAVIDTGIFEAHPDLEARLSDDGYDFINNSYNAGDGQEVDEDSNGNGVLDPGEDIDGDGYLDDGQEIDNDANDPGDGYDNPYCGEGIYSSSFHGTHVAGTVGAETNNDDDSEDINENGVLDFAEDIDSDGILDTAGDGSGNGIAGVTWAGEIMNLRVLGCAGGYDFDIANAIRYAAGLENQSGIIVDDPADIANMSLGGGGTSSTMSNAIADATEAGLIIVAAAGNSATELPSYPAAYSNVTSVSATLTDDSLASYSNYGATVDVAAPGSKIRSTLAEYNSDEQKVKASYASYNGTSMAAPHVAGVASLMKSVYPEMSPSDFDAILISGEITTDLGDPGRDDLFGVGRIDAAKAVAFSKDIADGLESIPVTPILFIDETYLNYSKTLAQYSVNASNVGNGNLEITGVTTVDNFVIIAGPVQQNDIYTYSIGIDRSGLADGVYSSTASFSSNGGVVDVSLVFEVISSDIESEGNLGNISVILRNVETGSETPLEIQSAIGGQYSYSIDGIEAGVYEIHSGTDIDNDGTICGLAEACGAYPTAMSPASVIVNGEVSNRDFSLDINTSTYTE